MIKRKWLGRTKKLIWGVLGGTIIIMAALIPWEEKFWTWEVWPELEEFEKQTSPQEKAKKEERKQTGKTDRLTMEELKNKHNWGKDVQAAGQGMPFQFGGVVKDYQPVCPPNTSSECPTCKECTTAVGSGLCAEYQQITYTPALGSDMASPPETVCVQQSQSATVYRGGLPTPGTHILGGGASNIMPWVIGVGSP